MKNGWFYLQERVMSDANKWLLFTNAALGCTYILFTLTDNYCWLINDVKKVKG